MRSPRRGYAAVRRTSGSWKCHQLAYSHGDPTMKTSSNKLRAGSFVFLLLAVSLTGAENTPPPNPAPIVELSPFLVNEETDQGYYASQTLAGGRLRQDIKNIGSSIQVVTKEFMDDLGVTGVEELFQYTTSTEVGGILGNFTGATDSGGGDVSTGDARRNPDGATRAAGFATGPIMADRPVPQVATVPPQDPSGIAALNWFVLHSIAAFWNIEPAADGR